MITIEAFHKRLHDAAMALMLLSREFERLECEFSDLLCEDYPFSVCLLEVVHGMFEWQETIKNHMEAMEHGTETANS